MSAAMTWDSIESELRVRLAAIAYRDKIPFHRYKKLCEWLDCYQCFNPDDRQFLRGEVVIDSPSTAHNLWRFSDLIYTCLNLREQEMVWKLISES